MILAAAAALALVACAKVETINNSTPEAVSFGVYLPKTVATKAGAAGTLTTDGTDGTDPAKVFASLQDEGFGVFATYSDGGNYDASIGPNFMYNQKVYWDGSSAWTYSPFKYWPNETITDNNGANAPANADKLSFFAYAPYVGDTTNGNVFTGSDTEGITAFTANNATTDPKVTYTLATTPDKAVDLVWGVAATSGVLYADVHNANVNTTAGLPLINLTKPAHDFVIPFLFKHATSRLALKIQGAFDQVAVGGSKAAETKVTVESVTLSFPAYTSAKLNLNNTVANTPKWEDTTGDGANTVFTVSGDKLNATILDTTDAIPQTVEGVTATEKNLFVNDKTFFTLIPRASSTTVRVTITYYVTTADDALADDGSRIQNVIYKDITFDSGFAAGVSNTIKIILGLTSVQLEAEVEPWADGIVKNVDLPMNK